MEDKVMKIIANKCKSNTFCLKTYCLGDCERVKETSYAIREALAQELEELKEGNYINWDIACKVITDCQAKLREGGK